VDLITRYGKKGFVELRVNEVFESTKT